MAQILVDHTLRGAFKTLFLHSHFRMPLQQGDPLKEKENLADASYEAIPCERQTQLMRFIKSLSASALHRQWHNMRDTAVLAY